MEAEEDRTTKTECAELRVQKKGRESKDGNEPGQETLRVSTGHT